MKITKMFIGEGNFRRLAANNRNKLFILTDQVFVDFIDHAIIDNDGIMIVLGTPESSDFNFEHVIVVRWEGEMSRVGSG